MPELRDAAARAAALDPTRSCIVRAPAGAGKTELLIQRYLALLANAEQPEEILALTFTRKAAAEMRRRVIEALHAARLDSAAASPHERVSRELAQAVLKRDASERWALEDNPTRLRIFTIDAFCAGLAARLPLLARFGAVDGVVDDASALYAEAAQATLQWVEHEEHQAAISALLEYFDYDWEASAETLVELLQRRATWARYLSDGRMVRSALEESLRQAIEAEMAQLAASMPPGFAAELQWCMRYAASHNALADLGPEPALPAVSVRELKRWRSIVDWLLKKDGKPRDVVDRRHGFPPEKSPADAKTRMLNLCRDLSADPALLAALQAIRLLPDPRYGDAEWRGMEALHQVLALALAQLQLCFARHLTTDHSERLLNALAALGDAEGPSELALRLEHRLRHILIDEFQDTALAQFDLLAQLTDGWSPGDGHTLFAVGDPMQSIYRFRDAEVGLFLRAQDAAHNLLAVPLASLELQTNFRSQARLVDAINQVFSNLSPKLSDPRRGAVPFSAAQAQREALPQAPLRLLLCSREDEISVVVAAVRAARAENPNASVAVLTRKRAQASAVASALAAADVPVRSADGSSLAQQPGIVDLVSLTRALAWRQDRVAWLALLRGPFCGLSLDELERLAAAGATLWEAARSLALPGEGGARVRRLVDALAPVIDAANRLSLEKRVRAAWRRLGGDEVFAAVECRRAREFFFAELAGCLDAGELTRSSEFERRLSRREVASSAAAAVEVMTIHKAKGLEFDWVLLPFLGQRERSEAQSPKRLRWLEDLPSENRANLLFAARAARGAQSQADAPIFDYVTRREQVLADNEALRLLYVAMTRARNGLLLCGALGDDGKPVARSPLHLLWPSCRQFLDSPVDGNAPTSAEHDAPNTLEQARLTRLPLDWHRSPAPAPPAIAHASVVEVPAPLEFSWAGAAARAIGTVTHSALQHIAGDGVEHWSITRLDALESWLRAALHEQGLARGEVEPALATVRTALHATLQDARGRWLLSGEHTQAASELRLSACTGGAMQRVVIDRSFIADGTRWLVDYKTGQHHGGDVAGFVEREVERYRGQLESYGAIVAQDEPHPIKLGLYFPLLGAWREWDYRS